MGKVKEIGNINSRGICIYCCGKGGRVGWIAGWTFKQMTGEIWDLNLTLNHEDAIIMDREAFSRIEKFLDRSGGQFGNWHAFDW